MTSCSSSEIRRCRPLLGTFVEVTARGLAEPALQAAVEAAFAAIEKIHKLMSAHDPGSEVSLLNRKAAAHPVGVGPETFEVLRRATALAAKSEGAFDPTVGSALARWGFLPSDLNLNHHGDWSDIQLSPGGKVRFLKPLVLDLGGIAKGFAVDQAIEALRCRRVPDAVVNAGGDLRLLGPREQTIHLRHPVHAQSLPATLRLRGVSLATSSPYFSERNHRGRRVSQLVNSPSGKAVTGAISVSVRARECWLADALTKVVLNAPERARCLLARYDAEAYVFTA